MRCSIASLERGESLHGTAPVARRWLMIEVAKAWESDPLATAPLAGPIADVLAEAEANHSGRVVLVRRPGRSPEKEHGRWWAVDTTTRRQLLGQWSAPADLLTAAAALGQPLSNSTELAEPALLVCTHGTRDVCCAIEGRQVARVLADAYPERVWECTHLGGHRFAPTFAVLPDGAVYGRVRSADALALVEAHLAGRVTADRLRGISRYTEPEQVAVCRALEAYGPASADDVKLLCTTQTGESDWEVRLGGTGALPDTMIATVHGERQPPQPLSCGPAKPKLSTAYAVTSLVVED